MLGHKLSGSSDASSLPSDEQLLEAYKNAYSQLRVYPDNRELEERLLKVERELIERNSVIAELASNGSKKSNEVEELHNQIKVLTSRMEIYQKNLDESIERNAAYLKKIGRL